MIWTGIATAAFVGSLARVWVSRAVSRRTSTALPWGTLVVNITGAFALGLVIGIADGNANAAAWQEPLGAGLLGAYTTFSGWHLETLRLIRTRGFGPATASVLLSTGSGLITTALALYLGRLL